MKGRSRAAYESANNDLALSGSLGCRDGSGDRLSLASGASGGGLGHSGPSGIGHLDVSVGASPTNTSAGAATGPLAAFEDVVERLVELSGHGCRCQVG